MALLSADEIRVQLAAIETQKTVARTVEAEEIESE